MNFKTIQRTAFLYEELKKLDSEIIAIDKMAISVSEHKSSINLRMTATVDKPEEKQNILDADGSLTTGESPLYRPMMFYFEQLNTFTTTSKPAPDFDLDHTITDTVCLQVLGIILSEKNALRTLITNELKEIFKLQ